MPEVIPELAYIVGLFFAVVGYIAARGLLATWTHSLGYLLQWLANHARIPLPGFLHIGHHIDLGGPFRDVDSFVVAALQNWCAGAEIEMGYCLHGMRKVALYTAQMVDWLARETDASLDWLGRIHVPRLVKYATPALLLPLLLPKLIRAILPHVRTVVYRPVRVIYRTLPAQTVTIVKKAAAVAIPGAVALPGLEREVKGLGRWAWRANRRLLRVEGLFGAAAMAAAMANVLGLPNWRCLTRGNIGKVARRLCGLGPQALEDLLGLLVDVLIIEDICQVVTLLEDGLVAVQGTIDSIVGVVGGSLCHGDYKAPATVGPFVLSLPAVSGYTLNPA